MLYKPPIHADEIGLTSDKYIALNYTVSWLPLQVSYAPMSLQVITCFIFCFFTSSILHFIFHFIFSSSPVFSFLLFCLFNAFYQSNIAFFVILSFRLFNFSFSFLNWCLEFFSLIQHLTKLTQVYIIILIWSDRFLSKNSDGVLINYYSTPQ